MDGVQEDLERFMEEQTSINEEVRADISDLQGHTANLEDRTAEATLEARRSDKVAREAKQSAGRANARTRTMEVKVRRQAVVNNGTSANRETSTRQANAAGSANAGGGGNGSATGSAKTADAAQRPPRFLASRLGNGMAAGLAMFAGFFASGYPLEGAISGGLGAGTLMYFTRWLIRRSITYRIVAIFSLASILLGYGFGILVGFLYWIMCVMCGI